MAPGAELLAPHVRRRAERGVGIAATADECQGAVGAVRIEQQHVIARGRFAIRHHRERFDIERDPLDGVLAKGDAVRQHDRDRLADITHFRVGDHGLLERLELGQRLQPHADDRRTAGHIARRDDRVDAWHFQCSRSVDPANAAMRDRTAQNDCVKEAVRGEIVDIAAAAADEPQILSPLDRTADEGVLHDAAFIAATARGGA